LEQEDAKAKLELEVEKLCSKKILGGKKLKGNRGER